MKFIGAHIFDYDATFRSNVNVTGNLDVDGTINIDAADIDGNLQLDGTLTVGVDDTGYDVKFFGATSGRYMLWDESDDSLQLPDNTVIKIGTGLDLKLKHDGTDSYIDNTTGNLKIRNFADDKDIIFQCDDGSGGITTYFMVDGGLGFTTLQKNLRANDDVRILVGSSQDAEFFHDGLNTSIRNITGDLQIRQAADDKDIIFKCDDGSGGETAYLTLDGSEGHTVASKEINFSDGIPATFGDKAGGDLEIKEQGGHSYISNFTGNLEIINHTNDGDIIFKTDDGSGGVTEYLRFDGSSEKVFYSKNLLLFDGVSLQLGTGTDAALYHDGSEGTLQNYTGNFRFIQSADNSDIQFFCDDGAGGTTEYFRLDGGFGSPQIIIPDGVGMNFGNGLDLRINHDGSNSVIQSNGTGNLEIKQKNDNADIIFSCDDGSGGTTAYMTIDGSAQKVVHNANAEFSGTLTVGGIVLGSTSERIINVGDTDSYIGFGGANQFNVSLGGVASLTATDTATTLLTTLTVGADGAGHDVIFRGATSGRFLHWDESADRLQLADNTTFYLGSGLDLGLFHNGAFSEIVNNTGDLYIKNQADDKDIIFFCDDGSGGTTEYFKLDGSVGHVTFPDNQKLYLGSGHDAYLEHDGSGTYLVNQTGHLNIRNFADDSDIALQSDDGSGGLTDYIRVDGSATRTVFSKETLHNDNIEAKFGGGIDLRIFSDGTDGSIKATNGDLYIVNTANDKDIIFQSDDGSGGVETYFFLDGSGSRTIVPDNKILGIGTSTDMYFSHNGTHSEIVAQNGNLTIKNTADEKDIIFQSDDGSGGTTAYFTLDGSTGHSVANKEIQFLDSVVARFGVGNDLAIYHNGTSSFIDSNTGNLNIRHYADDGDIIFQCDDGSGGLATYMTIDGSDTDIKVHKNFEIEKTLTIQHSADPPDPATGHSVVWSDTSGNLKVKINVAGTVVTRTLAAYED